MRRRTILRGIGASTVGGVAAAGAASASSPERENLEAELSERSVFEHRLTRDANAVLATLSERGLIERADTTALPMDSFQSDRTRLARDSVTDTWAVTTVNDPESDGTFEPLLMVGMDTPEADIRLFARPARNRAYAFVNPEEGDRQYITTDGTTVSSLECDDYYVCGDVCINCVQSGFTTRLEETIYYESYQCSYDRCCSSVSGRSCGEEDCLTYCAE